MLVIGQVKFKLKVTAMLLYVICYVVVDGSVGFMVNNHSILWTRVVIVNHKSQTNMHYVHVAS